MSSKNEKSALKVTETYKDIALDHQADAYKFHQIEKKIY